MPFCNKPLPRERRWPKAAEEFNSGEPASLQGQYGDLARSIIGTYACRTGGGICALEADQQNRTIRTQFRIVVPKDRTAVAGAAGISDGCQKALPTALPASVKLPSLLSLPVPVRVPFVLVMLTTMVSVLSAALVPL